MFFYFKSKKIVVDAFINSQGIYEMFPIRKSSHFIPDWWKNLSTSYRSKNSTNLEIELPTMKNCEGFISLYKNGFMIPLWADLIIEMYDNDSWQYQSSDQLLTLDSHNPIEFGHQFKNLQHFKIVSPWLIKENSCCKFVMIDPLWNNLSSNQNFKILPGIVDYKYQNGSHINFFTSKKQRLEIQSNTPIAQVLPLSEKPIDIRCHLIDDSDYNKISRNNNYGNSFFNRYRKRKKLLESEKKCPF